MYNGSMSSIVSAQRAIRSMTRFHPPAPTWIAEASTLERAGIARYASEELERYAPLTPLEALIGSVDAKPERKAALFAKIEMHHPQLNDTYLENCISNQWRLGQDTYWKTLPDEAQLLMARYAAVTLNVLRPKRSGDFSTCAVYNVLDASPAFIQKDVMLQRIVACNNPSLFSMLMDSKHPVDPQAVAIGFLHGRSVDRAWYDRMDNDAFASLIVHDKTLACYEDMLSRVQDRNVSLHRYPWEKLPIVFEHNPARFIASMVMNKDVANAHSHAKQWFVPMLAATARRVACDPSYASSFAMIALSRQGRKNLNGILERHDPEAYASLELLRQLHDVGSNSMDHTTLLSWMGWLSTQGGPSTASMLPGLDNSVFEETSAVTNF